MPLILIGVSVDNSWSTFVLTVTILDRTPPLPASILLIWIGSDANAPTISNSGLFGSNPSGFAGNLSILPISLVDDSLYAFDNFA